MEKLNIAEILKDCPKGMELDCTMFDKVTLIRVDDKKGILFPIKILREDGYSITLTKYGQYTDSEHAKCVIFPKGKATWEGFQRPFKDGDVVVSERGDIHLLRTSNSSYCAFREKWKNKLDRSITIDVHVVRFATEEEKQKLFDAIKANGYKWNAETRTLEKLIEPKFKVGDKIVERNSISNPWIVSSVSSEYYGLKLSHDGESIGVLPVSEQDDWELVPDKFDITTLKPFDKVLVRDTNGQVWTANLFSHVLDSIPRLPITFVCVSRCPNQCIPYESNEHLLGTSINCDDYYKTWE